MLYASESGISPSALWATWLELRLNLAFCFDERRELWEATKKFKNSYCSVIGL